MLLHARRLAAPLLAGLLLAACAHPGTPALVAAVDGAHAAGPVAATAPAAAASEGSGSSATDPAPAAPGEPAKPEGAAAPAPAPAPSAAPAAGAVDAAAIAGIRAGVDAVLRAQADAIWRAWTGRGRADPAAAWKGHEALLRRDALARVGRALAAATGDERRALAALRAFLAGEVLAREIAPVQAKLDAARAAATFAWDGQAVPLARAPALLAGEPDAQRRAAIARAADAAAAALAPLADARDARLAAAARALGWPSTLALAADLRGATIDALAALADAVLARTDEAYRALLDELGRRELSLGFADLRARDLPRLFAAAPAADAFPADRALADVSRVLAGLGLDLATQKIDVDGAARPGKAAPPLALPVDPPGDVRLSFVPAPGLAPLRALLDAAGVAERYANVATPVLEFRRLGSAALPDAAGLLLEAVATTPEWLADRDGDAERRAETARAGIAERLHRARTAAARVLWEIARAKAPERAAAAWAEISTRAFGHPDDVPEPVERAGSDPLLRAAEDLRAEVLAAQLEGWLAREDGTAWWRSERAGAWLRAAWADGGRRTPDELAATTGATGLDPGALDAIARDRMRR